MQLSIGIKFQISTITYKGFCSKVMTPLLAAPTTLQQTHPLLWAHMDQLGSELLSISSFDLECLIIFNL